VKWFEVKLVCAITKFIQFWIKLEGLSELKSSVLTSVHTICVFDNVPQTVQCMSHVNICHIVSTTVLFGKHLYLGIMKEQNSQPSDYHGISMTMIAVICVIYWQSLCTSELFLWHGKWPDKQIFVKYNDCQNAALRSTSPHFPWTNSDRTK
jgi:hypothetical protein